MGIKQVENKVNEILNVCPEARDNDNLLFAHYLQSLSDEFDYSEVNFAIVAKKLVTKFKSVERTRRKLQEKNPELRGERWKKRHEAQAEFVQYALDIVN